MKRLNERLEKHCCLLFASTHTRLAFTSPTHLMPPVASPAPPPSSASAPSPSPAALAAPSITITGPSAGSIIVPASLPPPPPPAHPDHQPASATTASTTASKRADKEKNHHSASAMASTASGGTQPGAASKQGQGSFMAVGIAAGAEDAKYQAKYKELKRKVKEIESVRAPFAFVL